MKRKQNKRFIPGQIRAINFDLFHNGLYRMKVVKNKKKETKKFDLKKEISSYLNVYLLSA